MANKKFWLGMLVMVLAFNMVLTGCATISKENIGSFPDISVPAKDFTSLGLVMTENVVENNKGEGFTYYELLKLAKELGADTIVNVAIDVKREGTRFLGFYLSPKETWYGSATAIKYTTGILNDVTTNNTSNTTTTKEGVIMSARGGGSGSPGTSNNGSSEKKWYNPFTWFK